MGAASMSLFQKKLLLNLPGTFLPKLVDHQVIDRYQFIDFLIARRHEFDRKVFIPNGFDTRRNKLRRLLKLPVQYG